MEQTACLLLRGVHIRPVALHPWIDDPSIDIRQRPQGSFWHSDCASLSNVMHVDSCHCSRTDKLDGTRVKFSSISPSNSVSHTMRTHCSWGTWTRGCMEQRCVVLLVPGISSERVRSRFFRDPVLVLPNFLSHRKT